MRTHHHDWTGLEPPSHFRYRPIAVQASGALACFTRPETSSERLSYPVMTPTAAVGLLTAIYWKPQLRWVVTQVDVLAPVRWTQLRRNESDTGITAAAVNRGYLDVDDHKAQRMTTLLRDVRYRIHAHAWVHPEAEEQDAAKHRDQLLRRVRRGQHFRTPFLGMRELHADVEPADKTPPVDWSEDLGVMLHSVTYDDRTSKETYDWFEAKIEQGVLHIPRLGLLAQHNRSVAQ